MKGLGLRKNAKISSLTFIPFSNDENGTVVILAKLCNELKYNVSDIIDFIPSEKLEEGV